MLKQSTRDDDDNDDRSEEFDTAIIGLFGWIMMGVVFTIVMAEPNLVYSTRCAFIFLVMGSFYFLGVIYYYRKELMNAVSAKCTRERWMNIGHAVLFFLLTIAVGTLATYLFPLPQTKTIRHVVRHQPVI
jgi:undecaprenyl pyrophosphate phosphatase UppP